MSRSRARQDITTSDSFFAGEDQTLRFTIYDEASNEPEDITAWTLEFKMATAQGGEAVLTKGVTLVTPDAGVCSIDISAGDTSGLSGQTYFYTLRRTDSGSNQVVAYGNAVLQVGVI